ncbi:MAG TPA: hypothetical protein VF335_07060, partial [Chitinivibrionales bacterium]
EFREKEEMEDLTHECNSLADFYRNRFVEIRESMEKLEHHVAPNTEAAQQVAEIKQTLAKVNFY